MHSSPTLSDLISPEYLAEQQRLHDDPRGYGGRGSKWAEVVADLVAPLNDARRPENGKLRPLSILDYGAGQCTLGRAVAKIVRGRRREGDPLNATWDDYDVVTAPTLPRGPYDLVVCTDVLEHIEPEKIDAVLAHLRTLTRVQLFTVISTVETEKTLSDGRQAHILLRSKEWWFAAMHAHGFAATGEDFPNPKPEKQFVTAWRPT